MLDRAPALCVRQIRRQIKPDVALLRWASERPLRYNRRSSAITLSGIADDDNSTFQTVRRIRPTASQATVPSLPPSYGRAGMERRRL